MAFEEDLSEFFDESDFADTGTVKGVPVIGIFQDGYVESVGFQGRNPFFVCPEDKVPGELKRGDPFEIDDKDFKVAIAKPDGTGLLLIELEAVE